MRIFIILLHLLALTGCATTHTQREEPRIIPKSATATPSISYKAIGPYSHWVQLSGANKSLVLHALRNAQYIYRQPQTSGPLGAPPPWALEGIRLQWSRPRSEVIRACVKDGLLFYKGFVYGCSQYNRYCLRLAISHEIQRASNAKATELEAR